MSDVRRVGSVKKVVKAAPLKVVSTLKHPARLKESAISEADFADDSTAAKVLNLLLQDAVAVDASAVHIEPHPQDVFVRYRVDGLLRPGKVVQKIVLDKLAARVKSLANLDVIESRVPQDGRFETDIAGQHYVVRASLLPVADGEKIVLHIVDKLTTPHALETLGYWGHSLVALQDAASQAHGLVVVGGPAGAGTSATLYGLLQLAADPSRNVATVESVIEHRITGISQTPVNTKAGMTFASAVRAVLHQDPNVLMISDVNEPETANMALQAGLAGRLVFVGMHTHDVAAALAQLEAMEVQSYLLASTIKAVANQRLVRRLCASCRQAYKPAVGEFEAACNASGLSANGAISHLVALEKSAADAFGIKTDAKAIAAGKVVKLWRANPDGCDVCGNTGYKGRIAIAEVLVMSPAMQKLVFSNGSAKAVYDQAIVDGMLPLPMDGFTKAILGLTSIEEVLRVVTQ